MALITSSALFSCDGMFDYSPYSIDFSDENRNVNQRNIKKLTNQTKYLASKFRNSSISLKDNIEFGFGIAIYR